jgi:hypothetical protein
LYVIQGDVAEAYVARQASAPAEPGAPIAAAPPLPQSEPPAPPRRATGSITIPKIAWSGVVPPQKWMNFYTKVLSRFATGAGLTLNLRVEVAPPEGVSMQKIEETKAALRDLGMEDDVQT